MPLKEEVEHVDVADLQNPGTIIESAEKAVHGRVLVPQPSQDPNDPLVSWWKSLADSRPPRRRAETDIPRTGPLSKSTLHT